jgi:transcription termination/antitermination protein NusG
MALRWYVVHTYSGFENRAKEALEERVRALGLADRIADVLVPTEQVVEVRGGRKRLSTRKFFPGYLLVRMELDNETWHVVKNTPKITGFVGDMRNPPPVSDEEVARVTDKMSAGETGAKPVLQFERGEEVRVTDGPFASMMGNVEEVNPARGKLRVLVTIFGRATAVELDYSQVEKAS